MENDKKLGYNGAARSSKGTFIKKSSKRYRKTSSSYSKEVIFQVIEGYFQGKSVRAIAKEIKISIGGNVVRNISKTAVHNILAGISG